ncbi:MAG: DUF4345 domain-containing protein [Chloroflexota bacterium]
MKTLSYFLRIIGLVPLLIGFATLLFGLDRIPEVEILYPSVDSDLRFLAGVFASVGGLIVYISFHPKEHAKLLLYIFAGVLLGNVGRVISFIHLGPPGAAQYAIFIFTMVAASVGFVWIWLLHRNNLLETESKYR